ncbi:hypothetical protein DITRI_Ditri13aG0116300 [Diplodiscus trichospermus]
MGTRKNRISAVYRVFSNSQQPSFLVVPLLPSESPRLAFFHTKYCNSCVPLLHQSRRERDRERAQARSGNKGKNKDDGLTPEQRRERDAKALQEKAAKKAAQAQAGGNNASGGGGSKNKK